MENSLLFGPFIVDAPAKVGIICAALLVLLFVVNSACKEPELFWGGAVGFLIFCAFSVVAVFMAEDMEIRNGYMFGSAVFFFFGIISAVTSWLLKRRKPEREIEAAIPQEEKSKTDDILTELR